MQGSNKENEHEQRCELNQVKTKSEMCGKRQKQLFQEQDNVFESLFQSWFPNAIK